MLRVLSEPLCSLSVQILRENFSDLEADMGAYTGFQVHHHDQIVCSWDFRVYLPDL